MKKLFERVQDNLAIELPTEHFIKTYCNDSDDVLLNSLAYVGYIHFKYVEKPTGTYRECIEAGVEQIGEIVDIFLGNPKTVELAAKRYSIGILSGAAICKALWADNACSKDMGIDLWRVRVHLEAYVEAKLVDRPHVAVETMSSAIRLRNAHLLWRVAQRRVKEIRAGLPME